MYMKRLDKKTYIKNYRRLRYKKDEDFREKIKKNSRETYEKTTKEYNRLGKCIRCGGKRDKPKILKDGTKRQFKLCPKCRKKMMEYKNE